MAVITLCGSSRFADAFHLANMHLSLQGHVVISLGAYGHADEPQGAKFLTSDGDESTPAKQHLDELHFKKIDLADRIMVINLGGYVGSSTKREIDYAKSQGKRVDYFFPQIEQEVSRPYSMALPVDNAWTAVTVKVDRINGIYTKEVVY